jgi:hypothetical protein
MAEIVGYKSAPKQVADKGKIIELDNGPDSYIMV